MHMYIWEQIHSEDLANLLANIAERQVNKSNVLFFHKVAYFVDKLVHSRFQLLLSVSGIFHLA